MSLSWNLLVHMFFFLFDFVNFLPWSMINDSMLILQIWKCKGNRSSHRSDLKSLIHGLAVNGFISLKEQLLIDFPSQILSTLCFFHESSRHDRIRNYAGLCTRNGKIIGPLTLFFFSLIWKPMHWAGFCKIGSPLIGWVLSRIFIIEPYLHLNMLSTKSYFAS